MSQNRSLHSLAADELNPYQSAMTIIAKTLEPFDEDGLIPAIGFGDGELRGRLLPPSPLNGSTLYLPQSSAYRRETMSDGGGPFHPGGHETPLPPQSNPCP